MKRQKSMLRKVLSVLLCLALAAAMAPAMVFGDVPVEKVVLSDKTVPLKVGSYYDLYNRIAILPYTGYVSKTYKSSAPSIASVDSGGSVKGIKPGNAVITVTAGGKSASVTVKVTKSDVAVTKLLVMSSSIVMAKGKTVEFPVETQPVTASNLIKSVTSSNSKVAKKNGSYFVTIKGVGYGTATIKLTMKSGKSASFKVTVTKDSLPTSVEITKAPLDFVYPYSSDLLLTKGQKVQIGAQVTPASAKVKGIAYYSNNTDVAKIDSAGNITAVNDGYAKIYIIPVGCWTGGKYISIYVGPIAPRSVEIVSPQERVYLNTGDTLAAKAVVAPMNATNKTILWESDKPSLATVDANGNVNVVADADDYGIVTITARAAGGDTYTYSTFTIYVNW